MYRKKLVWIVLGLGLALAFVWSRIHVIELGYAVTELEKEIEKLKQENGLLKTRLADALSTPKLVALAKKHEMHPPQKSQILFIPEEVR